MPRYYHQSPRSLLLSSVLRPPLHHPMFHRCATILGLPPLIAALLSSGCLSTSAVLLHSDCLSTSTIVIVTTVHHHQSHYYPWQSPIAVIVTISNPRQPPLLSHRRHRRHLGSPTATLVSSALGAFLLLLLAPPSTISIHL